ncbi:MAG: hypothetical protein H0T76_12930 [Nannocystis sp.]|nr:hypothetical protein [Nannocystis sp.]MBA3547384.1 hypothetical protein [Nannocystis sp.]
MAVEQAGELSKIVVLLAAGVVAVPLCRRLGLADPERRAGLHVCVDGKPAIDRIVALVRHEFPLTPVLARAYDRQHATELIKRGVTFQMRETFESAMAFGNAALHELGIPDDEIAEVTRDVRRRDAERLQLQVTGGLAAGRSLLQGNRWAPVPLTRPTQAGQALNEEAAQAIDHAAAPPPSSPAEA